MKKLATLALAAALVLAPGQASAQTSTASPLCELWDAGWTHCLGAYDPITGTVPGPESLSDAWNSFLSTQEWKTKADPSVLEQIGPWVFEGKVDVLGEPTAGSINLSSLVNSSDAFVLGLKAANSASFYVFNGGASSSFDFSMIGSATNGEGGVQGLSHFAVWTLDGGGKLDCTLTGDCIVPEPSSYALIVAGLAGLGFVARRRRNV